MPQEYGPHEYATLLVLALEGRDIPNPELKQEHGISLSPAGRAKLNDKGLVKTTKVGNRYVHSITDKGRRQCWQELSTIEPPARSNSLVRAVFEFLHRVYRGEIKLDELTGPVDLESLIRGAYRELATRPQDWVRLAKLRPKLDGADRSEVDDTLFSMTKTGLVHLAPYANRRALTEDDRDAAIRINGEDNHVLAIEES